MSKMPIVDLTADVDASLAEDLENPEVAALREDLQKWKAIAADRKRQVTKDQARYDALEQRFDLVSGVMEAHTTANDSWVIPRSDDRYHGVATAILSDLHLDEVVIPAQVEGSNAFNRAIAYDRLQRWTEKFISLASRDHLSHISYDGAALFMLGDTFSGNIHEELKETNEAPIMGSVDYWVDPIAKAIRTIASEFPKLMIAGRVGNHGRNSRKPVAKNRVEDNFDWLFMRILQRELNDLNIEWDLPLSASASVKIYDTSYNLTHGDMVKGGNGISGIYHPVALADFRSRKVYSQMDARLNDGQDRTYDWLCMGHWHQYLTLSGVIVNGSLKGYDEYAYQSKFGYEPPIQAFWVTTPEHGPAFHTGIDVSKRESEGW